MAGLKDFKEKLIQDEAFAKKFEGADTPEKVVSIAKTEGFNFTVEDVKNNTELTDVELKAVAGGGSIAAKNYFVKTNTIMAGGFVKW